MVFRLRVCELTFSGGGGDDGNGKPRSVGCLATERFAAVLQLDMSKFGVWLRQF